MPKHTINWVNDHIEICDRLNERVQRMQDYSEQVTWYRQSINALDYVGCVTCRRALETGQPFLEHYLPAFNFRDTERGTEYQRDAAFPILPELWTRRDPDEDERFDDAGETPDASIFDLRGAE